MFSHPKIAVRIITFSLFASLMSAGSANAFFKKWHLVESRSGATITTFYQRLYCDAASYEYARSGIITHCVWK